MFRIMAKNKQTVIRHQSAPRAYTKPELLATRPNELWSWDITKLKGPRKWTYFYLYVLMDVYSRFVVGWMLAERESSELAKALISESCLRQKIAPDTLGIHADNGGPMKALCVAQLMENLHITKTHSRPYTSNDNPFSESLFKTLKYRPEFPERFDSQQHAHDFSDPFFDWYNYHHRHSGIAMLTPSMVHNGESPGIIAQRQMVMAKAYEQFPERFVKGHPIIKPLPEAVYINPPPKIVVCGG